MFIDFEEKSVIANKFIEYYSKEKACKKIDAELNQFEAIAIESRVYRICDVYKIVKVITKEWNFLPEEMKLLR